jgi:hypothetical protein
MNHSLSRRAALGARASFFFGVALVLVACGSAPNTDVIQDGLSVGYDACLGKACGDACTLCPPGKPNCVETAVLKQCNAEGKCSPEGAVCGGAGPYAPCGGKACGDTCQVCPPGDPNCVEPAVLKFCHADGSCQPTTPACVPPPPPYDPCEGKACGAACKACPPGDPDCVETAVLKFCHADGGCKPTKPACAPPPYKPCAGKACGASCTVCDPNDPDCFETAVLKQCDATGACTPSVPICP